MMKKRTRDREGMLRKGKGENWQVLIIINESKVGIEIMGGRLVCFGGKQTSYLVEFIIVMNSRKELIKLKVCVIGDSQCGKTSFIRRLIGQPYESTFSTEQYEVYMYCVQANTYYLQVQLWDCSKNHLIFHKYLREAYFRNCSAALMLFDVNNPDWKERAHLWISEAYENQCYLLYAIGTKEDLSVGQKKSGGNGLEEKLNNSKSSNESREDEATNFFKQHDIRLTFQSLREQLKKPIKQLFMRMHNEYLIVSRGSLARGLSVRMPDTFQQPQMATYMSGESGKKEYEGKR